jgi:hypothetical protein
MGIEASKEDTHNDNVNEQQQEPPSQAGRPPSIVLTIQTNLIKLIVGLCILSRVYHQYFD